MRESSKDELDEVLGSGMTLVRESNDKISDFYRFPKSIEWRTVEPLSLVESLIPQSRFTKILLVAVEEDLEQEQNGLTAERDARTVGHPARAEYEEGLERVEGEYTLLTARSTSWATPRRSKLYACLVLLTSGSHLSSDFGVTTCSLSSGAGSRDRGP